MKTQKNGFTLMELLITTAVLGMISVVITQIFVTTSRTSTKSELMKEVKQNGEYALNVMTRLFQNAVFIETLCNEPDAVPEESTGSAKLTDRFGNVTELACRDDVNGARIASVSGSTTSFLTGSAVILVDDEKLAAQCDERPLVFVCSAQGGIPTSISMQFHLRQKGSSPSLYEQSDGAFQSIVTFRNK